MRQQVELAAAFREANGTSRAKAVRAQGEIPAVLYGPEREPAAVQVNAKAFEKSIKTEAGTNVLINLNIAANGKSEQVAVIPHDIQRNVLTGEIMHVDFYRINLKKKIEANVHVVLTGEAPAIKEAGGILVHGLREVRVRCLPTDIPPHIDVPLASLKAIGDVIHISHLALGSDIEVLDDPEALLVQIAAPAKEEEPAPEAAEGEAAQPEIVGKEKAEEGEGAGDEKQPEKKAEKKPEGK